MIVFRKNFAIESLSGFKGKKILTSSYIFIIKGDCYTQSRAPGCMTSCAASDGGGG